MKHLLITSYGGLALIKRTIVDSVVRSVFVQHFGNEGVTEHQYVEVACTSHSLDFPLWKRFRLPGEVTSKLTIDLNYNIYYC